MNRKLLARVPGLEIICAGQGDADHEDRFRQALAAEDISDAFRWLGWVQPDGLQRIAGDVAGALVPLADTLVNRARCPVKVLELMALGLPVAADPVGEVPFLLGSGSAGWLLPANDDDWVDSLAQFLKARGERKRLGARARQRVRTCFLWEHRVQQLEALYHRLRHRREERPPSAPE